MIRLAITKTCMILWILTVVVLASPRVTSKDKPHVIGSAVMEIVFGPPGVVWVFSKDGKLLKTTNGVSWEQGPILDATRHTFISLAQGWAVDDNGIVERTTDGGRTWRTISLLSPGEDRAGIGPIKAIEFTDELRGWVYDPFTLWRTTDGGVNWHETELAERVSILHFLSPQIGWAAGSNGDIYQTLNGGEAWQKRGNYQRDTLPLGMSFADERNGWVCAGQDGGIFRTTDGGQSWTKQRIPGKEVRVTSIQFLNKREGWATGVSFEPEGPVRFWFKSMLVHTIDGGENWEVATAINDEEWYHKIYFSNLNQGWLYTDTGLYSTMSKGRSWKLVLAYPRPNRKID